MKRLAGLLLATIIAISCTNSGSRETSDFVTIKGKKQHVLDAGKGDPPIVFITGSGSWLEHFDSVQTVISKSNRTISYDKPGIGKSEMIDEPRTLESMSEQLREILDAKGVKEPAILVGHSLGGMIARYFEIKHPDRVAGMVLVDPADEYLLRDVRAVKSESWNRNLDRIYEMMENDTTSSPGQKAEIKYSPYCDSVMRTLKTSSSIPVVLLESNQISDDDLLDAEVIEIKKQAYRKLQKEQLPQMKIISTEKSDHFIQVAEPNLVIDAIREVLKDVKE